MLLGLQVVAALVAGKLELLAELKRLPDVLGERLDAFESFAGSVADDLGQEQFIYLGLGPNAGLAEEATLKLKEMTQTSCEAYSPLEFRHGPISIVREGDERRDAGGAARAGVRARPGGRAEADIGRCVLYLPPAQLIAFRRARALGLDPDRPRNLSQVVVLNGDGRVTS
jgi:glutamine---fructose-6-phosphate transaminase (isomerizing)